MAAQRRGVLFSWALVVAVLLALVTFAAWVLFRQSVVIDVLAIPFALAAAPPFIYAVVQREMSALDFIFRHIR